MTAKMSSSSNSPPPKLLHICEITLHKAANVPISDLSDLCSDPYFSITLLADPVSSWDSKEQSLTFRTHTTRRTLNPVYECQWIVSGIPGSGFKLHLELKDEDPRSSDDELGQATLRFPSSATSVSDSISSEDEHEGTLDCHEREFKIHKRRGSLTSRLSTYAAKIGTKGEIDHHVRVWLSVRDIGLVEDQDDRRLFTVGPHRWIQHFSPHLGLVTHTTREARKEATKSDSSQIATFIANRLQLAGPVPSSLRHQYVAFAPFVKLMFTAKGLKGILLNKALKKQHRVVYKWDEKVKWGIVSGDESKSDDSVERIRNGMYSTEIGPRIHRIDFKHRKPRILQLALVRRFLEMVSYGQEGRIFTYVLMLDGELRFTETGEHLAIQFLSKHTMHSEVAPEVAFSGEFFVRLCRSRDNSRSTSRSRSSKERRTPSPHSAASSHPYATSKDAPTYSTNPRDYELIVDNDSGTYRPQSSLLQTLREFLTSERNFGRDTFGRVRVMEAFDETLVKWKNEQRELRKRRS